MRMRIFSYVAMLGLLAYAPTRFPSPGQASPAQADVGKPLAVLLSCRGDVTVVRAGGGSARGTFGLALGVGDEVRTGARSSAEILFESGNLVQVGEGSHMQVGVHKKRAGPSLGTKSFETVQNFLKLKDVEGTSSIARMRSGDKTPEIRAESPTQTRVRDPHPTFRWSTSEPITELRLTLYNEDGVHWQHDIQGQTSVTYPAAAADLIPGVSYSWSIETVDPLQFPPLRSTTAFFEVLSPAEGKALDAALREIDERGSPGGSAYHLVRASVFYRHGLLQDAIGETRRALETDPENPTLHSILARLYADTGHTREALEEYDGLLEKR